MVSSLSLQISGCGGSEKFLCNYLHSLKTANVASAFSVTLYKEREPVLTVSSTTKGRVMESAGTRTKRLRSGPDRWNNQPWRGRGGGLPRHRPIDRAWKDSPL